MWRFLDALNLTNDLTSSRFYLYRKLLRICIYCDGVEKAFFNSDKDIISDYFSAKYGKMLFRRKHVQQ